MMSLYRDRRVFIAGGLGFIGSHLAKELVHCGAQVTIVDALVPSGGGRLSNIAAVADRVQVHQVDLRDEQALRLLVREQSHVFCLAGQTSHIDSMRRPAEDLALNCQAQLSLLECCRAENPSAAIVYTSTRQIYGRSQYLPVDEAHPIQPADINGIHKFASEQYYAMYSRVYGMPTIALRLTNTYGPNMDCHPTKGFVGVFLQQALRGETIRLFGDGSQLRDFNYVSDVVSALMLAGLHASSDGLQYNLGHDEHVSLRQFVETLATLLPVEYRCQPFPDDIRRIDIGDYYASYERFHALTGWRPQVSLADGLERTLATCRVAESPAA
jgi:UDP-glucose 4-epimerase